MTCEFTEQMAIVEQMEINRIAHLTPLPTGSRYICPEAVTADSDWDYVCIGTNQQIRDLIASGWKDESDGSCDGENSVSLRKYRLNLIVFRDRFEAEHKAFLAATAFCAVARGPISKPLRIAVFEAFKSCHHEFETKAA